MTVWEGIRWLHLVAMAFFVGGQLVLAAAVVPALRGVDGGAPLRAVARRFGAGTLVALAVLVLTGAAMASHFGDWGRTTLQVKLALVAVAGALVAWHVARSRAHALDAAILVVSLAIVWLGVALSH